MERTIKTLKLDDNELIKELQEIHDKNTDIYRMLLRVNHKDGLEQILEAFSKNNSKVIKLITILEYLKENSK
ncbi:hypothetical protein CIRMBP1248_01584 [Enterococcus cecorum]|uniref:hypothetical protein n=1 Tax=Enterococcus cecorum TaxID=44008 RepID=UPI00148D8DD1|nr:hypothetical protein [Enterococcus cecorum]CAI3339062.1 hypothetical protein CIRMBP1252_01080 [Enterococcus cecorum]CAI3353096.1 hypothetical protein CIRMBP1243_01245 [Enterococcus cecorum]CAI3364395.1 hypothetical protein CIRMBP1245_01269 [Enterococcus cecorum]CAI3389843.1 hypothetical protein CIRMBP1256_01449 [Enterococcus cecorum]CAI3395816.1 hypothetical protein CIRMBP1248_01584 [Enterococcus cecorum]